MTKTVKRALPLEIIKQLKSLLIYRRQKTSQQIYIKWEPDMQEIVEKYKSYNSPYLLPIAKGEGTIAWRQYKNAYNRITKHLKKKLGEMIGLSIPLTTYVARHSWASISKARILHCQQ